MFLAENIHFHSTFNRFAKQSGCRMAIQPPLSTLLSLMQTSDRPNIDVLEGGNAQGLLSGPVEKSEFASFRISLGSANVDASLESANVDASLDLNDHNGRDYYSDTTNDPCDGVA